MKKCIEWLVGNGGDIRWVDENEQITGQFEADDGAKTSNISRRQSKITKLNDMLIPYQMPAHVSMITLWEVDGHHLERKRCNCNSGLWCGSGNGQHNFRIL